MSPRKSADAYRVVLDQEHLRKLKHDHETDEDEEVAPPKVINVQAVADA